MPLRELFLSLKDALKGGDERSVEEFSAGFERFGGFKNVILVGSGRSGFRLLLESLEFEPGSEIIFPAYTFHPIPVVAAECGFVPVFVDVDEDTWNIKPEAILSQVTERTRAVVPTHMFGIPANMEVINTIARKHGLFVIEDCAHALGSIYKGRPVGNWGDAAIFTFAMSKNLPCWGGGAVVVKKEELAKRMRNHIKDSLPPTPFFLLRRQFSNITAMFFTSPGFFPWTLYPLLKIAGFLGSDYFDQPFLEEVAKPDVKSRTADRKSRIRGLSPLQATVGLRQLEHFPTGLERQVNNARRLRQGLSNCPDLQLQREPPDTESSFLYVRARVSNPISFRRALLRLGVDTKPDDMRNCAALGIFSDQPDCPAAERLSGHCVEIPCSHFYSERQIDNIAGCILTATSRLGKAD